MDPVGAFLGPVPATKSGALYGMHAYWSKKPHDAIRAFVRHYSAPGGVVLDPFCGSGGTLLAALLEGREGIGFDRSPAAVFIAGHYIQPAPSGVQEALDRVMARAASEAARLYGTRCDRCGGAAILKTTQYDHGSPRGTPVPVLLSYVCGTCRPSLGQRAAGDQDHADLLAIGEPAAPYPALPMMHRGGRRWGDTWRAGTSNFERVDQLYTPRNLAALATLKEAIQHEPEGEVRDLLRFAFSAHLFPATTMQQVREGGGGFAKGTYYVPRHFLERNVFLGYRRRVKQVLAGKGEIPTERIACIALADATSLPLPDSSADYIFTDPPYGGAVQYGELNFVLEAWLDFDTTWSADEIVVNRTRGLGVDHWKGGMRRALTECRRVLKPGGWMSLCFQATDPALWATLERLLADLGFRDGHALAIDPGQKSFNRLKPAKLARRDLVLTCRSGSSDGPAFDLAGVLELAHLSQ